MFVYIIIFIPTIIILKESINQAYMPVYELCVYSKSVIIERFDGIFMMILTLLFIIKTGTELSLVKASIKDLTGRMVKKSLREIGIEKLFTKTPPKIFHIIAQKNPPRGGNIFFTNQA